MGASELRASLRAKIEKYKWVKYPKRLQIAADLDVSRPTIDNYIKGEVRNLEFAEKLLERLKLEPKNKKQ